MPTPGSVPGVFWVRKGVASLLVTTKDLHYLSLSIAGMNHKNASYVAFDIE
jgi:hypothetical protein